MYLFNYIHQILYAQLLLISIVYGQLLNPDQSNQHRASVYDNIKNVDNNRPTIRLGSLHDKKEDTQDQSFPPASGQEFAKIEEIVMGTKNGAANSMEPNVAKMKPKKLKKILDDEFDPTWVSLEKPSPQNKTLHQLEYAVDPTLAAQIEKLNFSMRDTFGKVIQYDIKTIYHFKVWLMRQASCPMEYLWEDLGPLFWPRWIKRGVCSAGNSCSWPPGMQCRNSGTKKLKMLRWVCSEKGKVDDENDPRFRKRSTRQDKRKRKRHNDENKRNRAKRNKKSNKKRRRSDKEKDGWEKRGNKGRKERRRRRLILRFSETIGQYFCYWKQIDYFVTDRCSCMCS